MPREHLPFRPPVGYLDAVGGQPLPDQATRAWQLAMGQAWADPARLHAPGRQAGALLDAARASLATSLGARADEVYLTSSGPTAVQLAVQGLLQRSDTHSRTVVLSAAETMAVQQPAARFGDADVVPIDSSGVVDLDSWRAALAQPAALACLQAANPEVGSRQPLAEAERACAEAGVPLLVHAVQVIGRDLTPAHGQVLAMSARDWAGPAGVGVLVVRGGLAWRPDQSPDRGWVGGFPDVPGAVAAATSLELAIEHRAAEAERAFTHIAHLRRELPASVPGLHAVGSADDRLPHIVTFVIEGTVGEQIVHELAKRGISAASGSACTSDSRLPSQVLAAMGLPDRSSLRISLPLGFTDESIDLLLRELPGAVAEARL